MHGATIRFIGFFYLWHFWFICVIKRGKVGLNQFFLFRCNVQGFYLDTNTHIADQFKTNLAIIFPSISLYSYASFSLPFCFPK